LWGREQERARIDQALRSARAGRATVLVLRGEAGIGKTALLNYAESRAHGMAVARICGVESETDVAFAGLTDICRDLEPCLGAATEDALARLQEAVSVAPRGGRRTGHRLEIGGALLALLSAAAEQRPLVLIVDDAERLDSQSEAALTFAARRLEADPVAVLAAVREPTGALSGGGFEELPLEGLSGEAARKLLADVVRDGCSGAVADQLVKVTSGNPLALIELPRILSEEQLRGEVPLPDPLPIGRTVERTFAHQITALGEQTRLAVLVAAATDNGDLRVVVSAMERLELLRDRLEAAEDVGLLSIDGNTVFFRHPLVRSAVYQGAAASERRRTHRALAETLAGIDDERRAWHLAASALGIDEEAARLLDAVAAENRERAAYASAANAHERSARLGIQDCFAERLALAADAAWLAGDQARATALADEGLATAATTEARADLIGLKARIELHCGTPERAYQWFSDAADLVQDSDRQKAAVLLAEAIFAAVQTPDTGIADLAERLAQLGHLDDTVAARMQGEALVSAASVRGVELPLEILRERLPLSIGPRGSASIPELFWEARRKFGLGQNADASDLAAEAVEAAREQKAASFLPQLLRLLAAADYDRGQWITARAAATEAAELALELSQTTTACACLGLLAELEAATGDADSCERHASSAIEIAKPRGLNFYRARAERALGRLALVESDQGRALQQLNEVAARLEQDKNHEFNVTPLPDLIELYARSGDIEQAQTNVARLERLGSSLMPGQRAVVSRCRGLINDEKTFASEFERALELHEEDPFPYEQARTHLCYGERLRRIGERRAARKHLDSAATTFAALGAAAWTERADQELRATGQRVRSHDKTHTDQLTPREAQIAAQVATGRSNREIAATLYLTPKTVEFHLTRIYRKLDVRSRTQLIHKLTATAAQPPVDAPTRFSR
jgi:DNA-binding CsgD family transcriptional regulator